MFHDHPLTTRETLVYKIEIRWGKILQKTKTYRSQAQYEKWLAKHQDTYSHVYNVIGYQFINNQWVQLWPEAKPENEHKRSKDGKEKKKPSTGI